MSLTNAEKSLIYEEEAALEETLNLLKAQLDALYTKLKNQTDLARDLTAQIVNTTRAEEKVQIYSDEAVAHNFAHKANKEIKQIEKMLSDPYFAKISILEDQENDQQKQIDYKIGKIANPDCRIVDWRNAPIAQIYYEYEEGDFYAEYLQNRDRSGEVLLKRTIQVEKGELKAIRTKDHTLRKVNNNWISGTGARTQRSNKEDYGKLPDVLGLLSEQQYQSISQAHDQPVIIQGVAGSGKTLIAIHRLSFLLHPDNSDLKAEDVYFTLKSPLLHKYIKNTLEATEAEELQNVNLKLWSEILTKLLSRNNFRKDSDFYLPSEPLPFSMRRFLISQPFIEYFCKKAGNVQNMNDAIKALLNILPDAASILRDCALKFITADQIQNTAQRLQSYHADKVYDLETLSLAYYLLQTNKVVRDKPFKHLVIDEIQDFNFLELSILFNALKDTNAVTLMGDLHQELSADFTFPGWQKLQNMLQKEQSSHQIVQLKISHRSTREIMQIAHNFLNKSYTPAGRPGKLPIHFHSRSEDQALRAAIKWLDIAQNKYPDKNTAIICKDLRAARNIYTQLKAHFAHSLTLADQQIAFNAGMIIGSIKQLKGLEFFNVLIWDLSQANYPAEQLSQQELYVACTRAEENLALISYGKSSNLLKNIEKRLLRRYEFR